MHKKTPPPQRKYAQGEAAFFYVHFLMSGISSCTGGMAMLITFSHALPPDSLWPV
jgi:hypothetical protein